MPVQIANPVVVEKIDRLSQALGVGKTAAVEKAVDRLLSEMRAPANTDPWAGIDAIVEQMRRLPKRSDVEELVLYDENGLPI